MWSPTCGTFWIWGLGCDSLPHYGFGNSTDSLASQQGSLFTSGATQAEAVLYLVDGSVSGLRDYWFAGGKLHYVTDFGFKNAVGLDAVDLQETVKENALRGVKFMLESPLMPLSPSPPQ